MKLKGFVNLTPHAIRLNDGQSFSPSGVVARVNANLQAVESVGGVQLFRQTFGEVEGLPAEVPGTMYIVSAMVLSALAGSRNDVFAPATGHPGVVRNEAGHIVSVPGLVK